MFIVLTNKYSVDKDKRTIVNVDAISKIHEIDIVVNNATKIDFINNSSKSIFVEESMDQIIDLISAKGIESI